MRLRQNKDETIQNSAERLFRLAEEPYTAVDLPTNIVQRQLVEILTAGLRDDHIARKLVREEMHTFDDFVEFCRSSASNVRPVVMPYTDF